MIAEEMALSWGQLQGQRAQSAHEAALASDAICWFRGCSLLPSGLIIPWKDSQNSTKALILTVSVYCRARIKIRISQSHAAQGHLVP